MQALIASHPPPRQTGNHVRDRIPVGPNWITDLQTELKSDPWLANHRALLTHREGLAWKGEKLYIPTPLRNRVLKQCHDVKTVGHFGFVKTLHLVHRQFWWPKMRADIEVYVKGCPVCATSKPKSGKPLGSLTVGIRT